MEDRFVAFLRENNYAKFAKLIMRNSANVNPSRRWYGPRRCADGAELAVKVGGRDLAATSASGGGALWNAWADVPADEGAQRISLCDGDTGAEIGAVVLDPGALPTGGWTKVEAASGGRAVGRLRLAAARPPTHVYKLPRSDNPSHGDF